MNFSEIFIRRAVATTLVMLAITLFGVFAYKYLPVSDLPNVDFPTLVVGANLPGANPETMASAVATTLERQFSTIEGLDSMTSINSLGSTTITLQFALNRNLDGAAQDVQSAITQAAPLLPPGMPTPPTFRRVNPADQPIMFMSLYTDTLPTYKLHEYADTMMAQRISMVSGVAQVGIYGSQKYAVRIQVNPRSLATRGIGIDEVEAAVRRHNVNLPTGTLYGRSQMLTIQATGQLTNADAYKPIIVTHRNGAPVRLEEVATVTDSVEDDKAYSWFSTATERTRTIALAVLRQPGTNTVEVADRVKALLPSFQAQLPPSVKLVVMTDRAQTIRESYEDVQFTMVLTLGLVVMVIFLFLRNVSATIIPSLALPVSVIGTFAVMYLCGYSLDNLSMMALILAIGFVVDDAIVVLENIVRHMEAGVPPFRAALDGSREVGFTIVSMTISLAAVFIPLLFMGGLLGRLFREFAVTICMAILISGFVSVTLTPMLSARFLKAHHGRGNRLFNATERFFDALLRVYDRTLVWTLRHRLAVLLLSFAILGATVWLFMRIPKGFLPSEDIGQIFAITEAPQGASHVDMARDLQVMADIIRQDPAIESFFLGIGGTSGSYASGGPNFGRMFFNLKPRAVRKEHVDQVIARLRPQMNSLTGLRAFPQNPPAIRLGGSFTKGLYLFTLMSTSLDDLYRGAQELEGKLVREPGLLDVTSDLQIKSPQMRVVIDRDKASTLKVTPEQIENGLYAAYGPRWISTIYAPDNQYRVLIEVEREFQADPSQMSALYIRSSDGKLVPLDSLASLKPAVGPQSISHFGQLPAVTISFNLAPGVSLGDVVSRIQEIATQTLPDTVTTTFQGTAQVFQSSIKSLWMLLVLALLVVYIVLGILYESFVHPITILSGLPSAGFGALLTLWLFRLELNIYSFVGLILLIGIVKKNAIMMIDFAIDRRRVGLSAEAAIREAALLRFRPIMMTTFAAIFGTLPIALGTGAGAELRQPLGVAVVGGLVLSQLLTLFITPVVYIYLDRIDRMLKYRLEPQLREVPEHPERPPAIAAE
jgi:HAE1 family hydrophobic/amphiphilic exporter-1